MGIWKNKDKRDSLKRGHHREIKGIYDEPRTERAEILDLIKENELKKLKGLEEENEKKD